MTSNTVKEYELGASEMRSYSTEDTNLSDTNDSRENTRNKREEPKLPGGRRAREAGGAVHES